jgi:hypothetical protein
MPSQTVKNYTSTKEQQSASNVMLDMSYQLISKLAHSQQQIQILPTVLIMLLTLLTKSSVLSADLDSPHQQTEHNVFLAAQLPTARIALTPHLHQILSAITAPQDLLEHLTPIFSFIHNVLHYVKHLHKVSLLRQPKELIYW